MANSALGSQSIALLQLPSGMLIDFAGTVEPVGWLMCDGRAVSRTTFSSLFASIGTAYGVGDGSTTFNLPDFRGRFARYNDNMGTAQGAASRDTGRVHGSSQTDGNKSHTHGISVGGRNNISFGNSTGNGQPADTYNTMRMLAVRGIDGGAASATNPVPSSSVWSSDSDGSTETRPINLACNKLIKI